MAASSIITVKKLLPLVVLLVLSSLISTSDGQLLAMCKFKKMYQLGDSFSDTGNLIKESPSMPYARVPYGSSFGDFDYDGTRINPSTGRASNGFLIIDYLAMLAGVPPLKPYKNPEDNFLSQKRNKNPQDNYKHGVNFAVAGSTALSPEVLASKRIFSPVTNSSLNVQLDWMSAHFNSTCLNQRDCVEKLENALFMVGEIGWNDYNYAIFQGKTMDELKSMVPEVVEAIMGGVRKSMSFGATKLVVPGIFPIGCLPIYKTVFQTNVSSAYDQNQCLKHLNDFAMYHNDQLQQAINKLKQEKPNAIIVYGDYYNAYNSAYNSLPQYVTSKGFEMEKACCGVGGKYNFNVTRMCGSPDVPVCTDPHTYMSWDGVHLTQSGNRAVADWLIVDFFHKFNCHY